MKKPVTQQSNYDPGLSPFEEIRLVFTCLGPALRLTKWHPVIVSMGIGFLSSFVVLMAAYRLLDGSWGVIKVIPKAVLIAALIGLNLIFRELMPYLRERLLVETEKAKRASTKDVQGK